MKLNDYQEMASRTAIYPKPDTIQALYYIGLGLAGEAGEVAGKISKLYRDSGNLEAARAGLLAELGDVLWFVSEGAAILGVPLQELAEGNLMKLSARASLGTLGGSGDNR